MVRMFLHYLRRGYGPRISLRLARSRINESTRGAAWPI